MSIPEPITGKGDGIPSWTIILFLEGEWALLHQDIQPCVCWVRGSSCQKKKKSRKKEKKGYYEGKKQCLLYRDDMVK